MLSFVAGFQHWSDVVFQAGNKTNEPRLHYALADGYLASRRYDAAFREYLRIARHHPKELPAYVTAMAVLVKHFHEPSAVLRVFVIGLLYLQPLERRVLRSMLHRLAESHRIGRRCRLALALSRIVA